MSFGSPTPIEVDVQGPNMPANRAHAAKIFAEVEKIPELRDLQYVQPLDYPTLDVTWTATAPASSASPWRMWRGRW